MNTRYMVHLTFGEWLQDKRRAAGMTQTTLGERVGMSKLQVSRLESGLQRATAERVRPMIEALNIDAAEAAQWLEQIPALSPSPFSPKSSSAPSPRATLRTGVTRSGDCDTAGMPLR